MSLPSVIHPFPRAIWSICWCQLQKGAPIQLGNYDLGSYFTHVVFLKMVCFMAWISREVLAVLIFYILPSDKFKFICYHWHSLLFKTYLFSCPGSPFGVYKRHEPDTNGSLLVWLLHQLSMELDIRNFRIWNDSTTLNNWQFLKKISKHLPYNSAIPVWNIIAQEKSKDMPTKIIIQECP